MKKIKFKKRPKIPQLEIEIIIAHILKKSREFVIAHPEYKLKSFQKIRLKKLVQRRRMGEAIAYLIGSKEFYGFDFFVNKNVLIPRPETELMIDEVTGFLKESKTKKTAIIDVGTGTGCIIIALAKLLKSRLFDFNAVDISKKALYVARKNAKRHKLDKKIKFFQGNLLEPIIKKVKRNKETKFIILANLPYLTPKQIKNSPSIKYEPKKALSAGPDGLKYYRELFSQIKKAKLPCSVFCEIDPSQEKKIKEIIKKNFKKAEIRIKKDLTGCDRFVIIE